jgi:hypothetical protein
MAGGAGLMEPMLSLPEVDEDIGEDRHLEHQVKCCGGVLVDRADAVEAVAHFEVSGGGLGPGLVVPRPGDAAVLADQGRDDVDVVVGMADGDPADRVGVAVQGEPDTRYDLAGDVLPLLVGQGSVGRVIADRGVPHVSGGRLYSLPELAAPREAGPFVEQVVRRPESTLRSSSPVSARWRPGRSACRGRVNPLWLVQLRER